MKCWVWPTTSVVNVMRLVNLLITAILIGCTPVGAALADELHVVLRDAAITAGRVITLADIATVESDVPANIDNYKAIRITEAPLPGRTRHIHVKTIRAQILAQSNLANSMLHIEGAAAVTVTTSAHALDKQEYLDYARHFLHGKLTDYPNLEIEAVGNYRNQLLPSGKLDMQATLIDDTLGHRMGVQMQLRCDAQSYTTIPVWFAVKGTVDIPYASHDIQTNTFVNENVVEYRRLDVSQLRHQSPLKLDQLQQSVAARVIKRGERINTENTMAAMDVTEGSQVTVILAMGGITITTNAKAATNAARGAVVKLINQKSNEAFQGLVIGPGLVKGI